MIQTTWRIEEYRTATGDTPVRTFLAGLPSHAKADAVALVKLAEILGNNLREPHSKPLGDRLFELRRNQVRIFYVFEPGRIVRLLRGMLKKQNRIPADVLARMPEYSTGGEETADEAEARRRQEVIVMARKSNFMRWIDRRLDSDAALARKVAGYVSEMMLEQKLTALRLERGMTQAQLAERLGVSQPHVAKLETGRANNLELRTLCRWATALGARLTIDVVPDGFSKRRRTPA